MSNAPTPLSFTKLVVSDLARLEEFYTGVFGFKRVERLQGHIGDDPAEEVILGIDGEYAGGLTLAQFTAKPAPPSGETILGFVTQDIDALFERALAAGAEVRAAIRDEPAHQCRVGYLTDPEGHLNEIVEMVPSA